ncbi:MAG: T9SS type A sorting domain-containing protein [Bacteroidetes bacterium]|nr:T9SS type A sorting domain-containing protein [Bacteroidota bacterium]
MRNYKNSIVFLFLISLVSILNAEGDQRYRQKKLYKSNGQPQYTLFNINNISTFIKNDGEADIHFNGNSGFEYPKGSNKHLFFQSGFLYGGIIDGQIRVGGATYNQGQVPGRIISEGIAEDPELPHVRIYRVRKDYNTAVLNGELVSAREARDQYEKDWNEWPAVYGAPFEDKNLNGIYEPSIDIPGVPGADQTIWFVCNDIDPIVSKVLYGSPPIGIEMQMTAWGYKGNEVLANTLFKKYLLINKSGKYINDMYVTMWSDPDVGDATEDFVGCDTTINLAYVYNGDDYDATYGEQIPAAGFRLLQGPLVNGNIEDTGKLLGRTIKGKKNLDYTSFSFFIGSDPLFTDPRLGNYNDGTLQMYNLMKGRIGITGQPFIDPHTGLATKFCLAGDPINNLGWIDGQLHPPGDRRMIASAGPFEMAAGDTQEVVYAQIAALGINRFESIKLLRFFSSVIDSADIYNFNVSSPTITKNYNGINDEISFEWDNSSENKNYDNYLFQGYRVYQYKFDEVILNTNGKEIAVFDKKDGIKEISGTVIDTSSGYPIYGVVYKGTDSGIKNKIDIEKDEINKTDFIVGKEYYFGVAAFYYNSNENKILESPVSTISAIYKENYSGPKFGDSIIVNKIKGIGSLSLVVQVEDPEEITGHDYKIWFTAQYDSINWNLSDLQTGEIIIENENLLTYSNYNNSYHYYRGNGKYYKAKGLNIYIEGIPETINNIEVVANQSGKLEPSEGGALPEAGFPSISPTDRQQEGDGIWLFHTGDNGGTFDNGNRSSYSAFQARSLRNDNRNRLIPYDWEMRFTSEGSWAVRAFQDGLLVKVPFELWCIGINSPDDPRDDYRMVPWILDNGEDFTYNLESWGQASTNPDNNYEHSVSGGDDDPFTDWIYWINPDNITPGSLGYDTFVSTLDLVSNDDGTYDYGGHEVMARTVLINLNGGSRPPFNQDMPETGTIFRITSGKYVIPGVDEYEFTTTSIENYLSEISTENKFTLSQNFPNPFNPTTKIKYKIPLENVFGVKNLPVKLIVYDILGSEVNTLVNTMQPPGDYEVNFNASNYSSGVYIYMLSAGDYRNVKKMVILK